MKRQTAFLVYSLLYLCCLLLLLADLVISALMAEGRAFGVGFWTLLHLVYFWLAPLLFAPFPFAMCAVHHAARPKDKTWLLLDAGLFLVTLALVLWIFFHYYDFTPYGYPFPNGFFLIGTTLCCLVEALIQFQKDRRTDAARFS